MSRQYPMFGLRMPPDLRERIEREAKIDGRSLNAEIVQILQRSFAGSSDAKHQVSEPSASYEAGLSDIERQFLNTFRRLPVEKQLALLSLFK